MTQIKTSNGTLFNTMEEAEKYELSLKNKKSELENRLLSLMNSENIIDKKTAASFFANNLEKILNLK